MATIRIDRLTADVKFRTVYVCGLCGKTGVGDMVSAKVDAGNADELKNEVEALANNQRSHDMPVGWSFCDVFKCPDCKPIR